MKPQAQAVDEFEELSESREIIEDRILRIRLQMIDLTIQQQEVSGKKEALSKDLATLAD